MRERTITKPGGWRLLASVLLVLGIALMHHVVVTGCSTLGGGHQQSHAAQVMEAPSTEPALAATGAIEPDGSPAAALCLAILLGAWLAAPIVRARRARCGPTALGRMLPETALDVPAPPPDLAELSVRRL